VEVRRAAAGGSSIHNNPCGRRRRHELEEAFNKAYEGDPLAPMAAVLAFNRELDEATARQVTEPNRFVNA